MKSWKGKSRPQAALPTRPLVRLGAGGLALLGLVVTNASVAPASAQVRFRSGPYWAQAKTPEEIRRSVTALAARPNEQHVLVQFDQPVSSRQRGLLKRSGLKLLSHLGDHAFFASLARGRVNADALSKVPGIMEVTAIDPVWKVHPAITRGRIPSYAIVDNTDPENPVVAAYVMFHRDVDLTATGTNTTSKHGGVTRDQLESVNTLVVELPWARLSALASEDVVQWIEWPLPRFDEINDGARAITEVDIVQAPPYGLDGTGVTALIYDGGRARATHVDFEGRLVVGAGDTSGLSDHSTHVACTVGGAGVANATYAGMAPAVNLVSYGFEYDGMGIFLYSNPGDIESDYTTAINVYGADISNNSIGTNTETNGFDCAIQGDYGVTSALIDAIVGGSLGAPFRVVWANGNERQGTRCNVEGYGDYYSTAPPAGAKNHITVGALNSNDDSMTYFSSWGPVDDGRMKPDISAPGCQAGGDGGLTSCSSAGDTAYTVKCGTSMAAPTTCGLSSLVLQDYRAQFPTEPDFRNSTLKILLAHNAVDLGNTGPDHRFGYGSVRTQQTVDFMRGGSFLENQTDQSQIYSVLVVVGAGEPELKVTLAWDDVPGTPNVNPALVNDLDLRVFDPSSQQHYPWTLDPLNPSAAAVRNQANHVDNIEQVLVNDPTAGVWRVEVFGFDVPQGPQSFSLCASPNLVACSSTGTLALNATMYPCNTTVDIQVVDCDLNTNDSTIETVTVTVGSNSEPGGESVVLTETAAESADFRGSIAIGTTDGTGVLLVADGDTVTATYIDADDGVGGIDIVVTATADVDCTAPQISNVQTTNIEPRTATVTFDSNEPARGTVHYGLSCGVLTAAATGTSYDTSVTVDLTGLQEDSTYYYAVDAEDVAGNVASDDNGGACYTFATPDIPEYFTEEFVSDNDLDNLSITFTPNGSFDFYEGCAETITALPTDPSGGSSVILSDDDYEARTLSGGDTVSLYGTNYTTFYIGSNGFITFGGGDTDYTESLADHFSMPRISPLFDDFNPSTGGTVSWQQLSDRAAVTWENVPEYGESNSSTFQVEMFFSGEIRMSYLAIAAIDGIAGLSEGNGLDPDFYDSNLSALGACVAPGDCDDDGDVDADDYVVFVECFSGPDGGIGPGCQCVALDLDDDVDCKDWNLFGQLWSGPGDLPAFAPCAKPSMTAAGGRYLAVTPAAGSDPVALLITGDPEDVAVSCVSLYVQADGSLDAAPLFLPPSGAGGWNTVYVHGMEVMPETTYNVQGDYGSPGSPSLSPARSATTWAWAEVEPNGVLNMTDIQWIIFEYEETTSQAPFEACNIAPCDLDDLVNFTDVQWAVMIYEGAEYRDDMCTVPCP